MKNSGNDRKLAAILAADVVGYSNLMSEDEAGTFKALSVLLRDSIRPMIERHGGSIVKLMGDGLLAEFASATDAVTCASEWQSAATDGNSFQFRIGVNLGDIIHRNGDIFGNSVNIAARLEALADPGGICVSASVRDQIARSSDLRFVDLGPQKVKNLNEPVQVFSVLPGNAERVARPRAEPVAPVLAPLDKPSIAVLPFDNMSEDGDQDYLADGITEDLITALSRIRWFYVIARNSTFTYKGKAVDVKAVSRELGVRYVLEGSIRCAGGRVRVTAQLIDASDGHHVWAERYDRQLEDIFELQDEMTQTIIGAVEPEISAVERARVAGKSPDSLDAWESFQRGVFHMWSYSQDDHDAALSFLTRASELDPGFAPAHAYRAYVHYQSVVMHWVKTDEMQVELDAGLEAGHKALAADSRDAVAYFGIGRIYMMKGRTEDAIAALESAIELNPSFAQAYHGLGMALCLAGRFDEAHKANAMCERLSPRDPIIWASLVVQALTFLLSRDYDNALIWAQKTRRHPNAVGYWPHAVLAATLAQLGQIEYAKQELALALQEVPTLSISELHSAYPTTDEGGLLPYLEGLRLAGLPE
ncbi:TolB amino-terminal domain-containing protein [Ruegeria halocynthiae]|uniref:TolB amino-terminal domain-containing protein n=1 Tax=Ruegeria halocynthiae TaxID=985054 RepID=A0A1H2UR29_9RHOB|nr:adenylate/guanylate cyclase domain-containing protein [Ruegeria halocynthiae]SDW58561.1 TolB amino-terminal domain-containing protein [Ruegeria halocynthiae]